MIKSSTTVTVTVGLAIAFLGGFLTHLLYQRWNPPGAKLGGASVVYPSTQGSSLETQSHHVSFVPLPAVAAAPVELPLLQAREVTRIRSFVGNRAHIRGRVFRVGHSIKSDTYFLSFGPSREALTAVIFASAIESFEKEKLVPTAYEGKEVEIQGLVKDHPQYGLEVILESPSQIKAVN
jgi:hypothetical protein